jgi:lysophospholipase L1-like esterase
MLYWGKDGHFNHAGYKVVAETVYSKLVEKSLVP